MEIHNHTFHGQDENYNRDICGYQLLNKISLARHKKIVHEIPLKKRDLLWHKRAVHEGVKYP